jgi:hypothetical protein
VPQRRGQAIDPLLALVVEDLHDFLWKQHITFPMGQERRLCGIHRQPEIKTARLEQIFL